MVVLKWDGKELDLVAKTVMRKKNFATSNQKITFEEFEFFPDKLHEESYFLLQPQQIYKKKQIK